MKLADAEEYSERRDATSAAHLVAIYRPTIAPYLFNENLASNECSRRPAADRAKPPQQLPPVAKGKVIGDQASEIRKYAGSKG